MVREGGFQPTDVFANPAAVAKYAEKDKNDSRQGMALNSAPREPSWTYLIFPPV